MDWTKHEQNAIVNGRRLTYLDLGEGQEAVLLLHGLGASKEFWLNTLAALSDSRRVIAVDLPGFGDSELAVSHDTQSVVDGLISLSDQLDLGLVDIVGHSMGTLLACELADREPERVRRLILTGGPILSLIRLYSSPFSTLRESPGVGNFFIEAVSTCIPIPARILRFIANHAFLRRLTLSPYVANPASLKPDVAAIVLSGAGSSGVIPTLRAGFHDPGERVHRNISHPTLVIAGAKDRIAPVTDLDEFASQEAVRKVVVLDDCGHCAMLEQPEAFNRELLSFLNSN